MATKKKTLINEVSPSATSKDPHAVALGRKGGLRGGPARANKLTQEQRSESARKAVMARWAKYRAALKGVAKKSASKNVNMKGSKKIG